MPSMCPDDGESRRQSQPGSPSLGGEERVPATIQHARLHPNPIVFDDNETAPSTLDFDSEHDLPYPPLGGGRLNGVLQDELKCVMQGFGNAMHVHGDIRRGFQAYLRL